MVIQTLKVEIPDGYELKYYISKIRDEEVNPKKKNGRKHSIDASNPDLSAKSKWVLKDNNRDLIAGYNRKYYLKKKEEKDAEKAKLILEHTISES